MKRSYALLLILIVLSVSFLYPSYGEELNDTPSIEASPLTYPNIVLSGYKRYTYRRLNFDVIPDPMVLPLDIAPSSEPWEEALKLGINGQLTTDLSVNAYFQQLTGNPDDPLRYDYHSDMYDIDLTYQDNHLIFGSLSDFYRSEFYSQSDYAGVMVSKDMGPITPFIGASGYVAMNYDDEGQTFNSMSAYRAPLYSGTDAFPRYGNYFSELDTKFWMNKFEAHDKLAFTRAPAGFARIKDRPGSFFTTDSHMLANTDAVEIDGQRRFRGLDYSMNYNRGDIAFNRPLDEYSEIMVTGQSLASPVKYSSSPGGIKWKVNDANTITAGYVSGTGLHDASRNYSITNMTYSLERPDNIGLMLDVNSSQCDDGSDLHAGGATAFTFAYTTGRLRLDSSISGMDRHFASTDLLFLGSTRSYHNESSSISYDISGGPLSRGTLMIGYNVNVTTTFESSNYYDKAEASIFEDDLLIDGWLGIYNRYQLERIRFYGERSSLLNLLSLDMSHFYDWADDPSKVYVKYLTANTDPDDLAKIDRSKIEVGTLLTLQPWSILISKGSDYSFSQAGSSLESSSYARLTYRLADTNVHFYADNSFSDLSGDSLDRSMSVSGFGMIWKFPLEQPVLSGIYLSAGVRMIAFRDRITADNSCDGTEVGFNGSLNF